MAQLDMKPEPRSHHIEGIPNNLLEANRPEFSLEDRLLVAAQRLLDEPQVGMNGNGSLYPLRYHQLPAFTNFSTYLMDFGEKLGSDRATLSIFKDYHPKIRSFLALNPHFHTPNCPSEVMPANPIRWLVIS